MPLRRPAAIAFAAGLVVIVGGTAGLLLTRHPTPALRPVAAGVAALPVPTGPIVAPPPPAAAAQVPRPASLKEQTVKFTCGGQAIVPKATFASVSSYQAIPANTWTMEAIGSGSTATARFNMAAGTVHTMVVLDGASGLEIVNLVDAAGAGQPPAGGVTTGFGGTAGHGPGSTAPWLAVIGAGALVAVGGGLRLRRHGLRRQMNTGV